jgi:hypothetical protein
MQILPNRAGVVEKSIYFDTLCFQSIVALEVFVFVLVRLR